MPLCSRAGVTTVSSAAEQPQSGVQLQGLFESIDSNDLQAQKLPHGWLSRDECVLHGSR